MKKPQLFRQNRSAWRSNRDARRSPKPRRIAFEALENRCLLSVGLGSLPDVTLPAGTTMFVPLAGSEPGSTLNFAVTASDYSKLTPVIMPQTNKSLQLNVDINGTTETMVFQLFDNLAPDTTATIENLVNSGFFNGLEIYRNGMDGSGNPFVIQGGNDPPTGAIKTDQPTMAEEFNPDLQFTSAGILAMARSSAPSTSSTEFFVTEEAARFLDFNYTVFGYQTAGTSVIQAIAAMADESSTDDPNGLGYLQTPVTITSASIITDTQNGVLELRAPAGATGTVTVTVTASDGTNVSTPQSFTVTLAADSSSNPANPFAGVTPTAPSSVAFVPPSGGSSQTTNLNNSSSGTALQFLVSGVTSGDEVEILADGNPIGEATASGTSVTVTTDGSTTLTDGSHTITAIQIAPSQTVGVTESGGSAASNQTADVPSLNSPSVQLTVDATPPQFDFTPVTVAVMGTAYSCQVATDDTTAVYALSQSPADMTIGASTGLISWTPATGQSSPVDVTVTATDPAGNVAQSSFEISVLPVNTPPVLVAANPAMGTTDANAVVTIPLSGTFIDNGTGTTTITDADANAVIGGIALVGVTGSGTWEYSLDGKTFTAVGTVGTHSALLLDKNAVLRYIPDGTGELANISYQAWDTTFGQDGSLLDLTLSAATSPDSPVSTASDTAWLTVNDVTDAVVLTPANPTLGSTTSSAAATISLAGTFIDNGTGTTTITDSNQSGVLGGIALTGVSGSGSWAYSLNGTDFTAVGTVSPSAALLLPGTAELQYTPSGAVSETATITYLAWDATSGAPGDAVDLSAAGATGGTTAFSLATDTASLLVNSAPVLTPAAPSMGTTDDNTAVTVSLTGTFINNGSGTTTITDADTNAVLGGIALVGVTGNGTWAYSLDGTTFTDVGTVSESSALLLPADAELQYTPNPASGETATITYRAWDTTSGQAGTEVDTTADGGATAFSAATDTASLTVISVNHAPVLTAAAPSLGTVVSSTADTIALGGTFINNGTGTTTITDIDQVAVVGGIALTGVTGSGTWTYSLDGTTYTFVGTVSATDALLLPSTADLRYTPSGIVSETATITYCAWDTTSGTSGTTADTTANGGATAFSTATDTASLTVNDAPVLTAANPSLGTTGLGAALTVKLAGTFINNGSGTTTITDPDTNAAVGGIALTGITGAGTWAYSLDGTTFTSILTVSASSALLLPSTAELRYTPSSTVSETATITYCAWDTTAGTAGTTADTAANGGATAFSTATDTASLTVAGGSISGYVYIDADNDGLRISSGGQADPGVPGVIVELFSQGSTAATATVLTASDGSYHFNNLAAGSYTVQELSPSNYMDGKDTLGTVGGVATGTAGQDQFQITLAAGGTGSEYNFGELGLQTSLISLRLLLASAPSVAQIIADMDVAPAVYLSGSAASSGYATTYTTGGAAANIASAAATISAPNTSMLASMTVSIINPPDGSSETLAVDASGTPVTSTYADGVLTLTGAADASVYQSLLTSITYSDTASPATAGDRTIDVVVNDGVVNSQPAVATVTVESASYAISADQSLIGAPGATAASFTFAGAEVGDTYNYSVTSSSGGTAVTGSGTISSADQQVAGINVSTLPDGTLTYSATLTDAEGNVGAAATATATLDQTAPSGYSILADQGELDSAQATAASFTFDGAEVGATYSYIVTSGGGGGSVTGSGTIASATQQVTGINVSTLPDGTLTYSVNLTDAAGNSGSYVAATTILDTTAPSAYLITADQTTINAAGAANTGFTLTGGEPFTSFTYVVTSSGGSGSVTKTGTVLTDPQDVTGIDVSTLPDGTLTYSVTLTDDAGNVGAAATATSTLDQTAPSGYSILADQGEIGAAGAKTASFTFTGAEAGATYTYTVTSGGGTGSVTGSGSISVADQQVTGIDVSSLPDGTLTYSVTLTDAAGNVGAAATATATLDQTPPAGYSIVADQSQIDSTNATATSFTLTGGEPFTTYNYVVTSSGGEESVTGSGTVLTDPQQVTGIDVSSLHDGTLTYSVTLTDDAGNVGAPATATATLETGAPRGYSVVADQPLVGASGAAAASFTFTGAEISATYNYTVTSSGGAGSVTGSGTIASPHQQVTGINVAPLPDGTLTYSVTLTDTLGNVGAAVTTTATLDQTPPAGYSIVVDQSQIDSTNDTATSFTFTGAELLATYNYTVTSDGGIGSVTGTGTISSADQQVTGVNVSTLPDGNLTYSVTLTDLAGNVGAAVTAPSTVAKALAAVDLALTSESNWLS